MSLVHRQTHALPFSLSKKEKDKRTKIRNKSFFFSSFFQINFKQSFTCNASQCSLMYTNRDSLDQKGIKSTIRMRAGTKLKANAKIENDFFRTENQEKGDRTD